MTRSRFIVSMLTVLMILSFTFTSVGAQAGLPENGAVEPDVEAIDPKPIYPATYIYDKYPAFRFTQFEDKTLYRILVQNYDESLYYKFKGRAECDLSECRLTPTTPLTKVVGLVVGKSYRWRVEVKMDDGTWYGDPNWVAFARVTTRFNSTFDTHRRKWLDQIGIWKQLTIGALSNSGTIGEYTSTARHEYIYGDYAYEARIKLKSKHVYLPTDAQHQSGGIIVHGFPYEFVGGNLWKSGINILIRNDQKARIFAYYNGEYVESLDTGWVDAPMINAGGWNTIKVVEVGTNMLITINDEYWYTYTDPVKNMLEYSGYVGLIHYRFADEAEKMLVDWAKLQILNVP